MAHEIETMAWAINPPWHGLGVQIDPDISVDDMLIKAGLDWEVKQSQVYAFIEGDMIPIEERRATYRTKDKKIFSITSEMWTPFQNKDVLEFFREYVEAGDATLETAGSLKGGEIVWALANLKHNFRIGRDDEVKGYLLLSTSHKLGRASMGRTTSVRVVCANTLAEADSEDGPGVYRQTHHFAFDTERAREEIGLAHEKFHKMELEAKALAQLEMSAFDTVRFLAKFFHPAEKIDEDTHAKRLLDDVSLMNKNMQQVLGAAQGAPGATPGTAWGILNGVTFWADHMAGRVKAEEVRLRNAWFGETMKTKLRVKEGLMELTDLSV